MDPRPRSALSAPVSWWVLGGIVVLAVGVLLLVAQVAALPALLAAAPDAAVAIQPAWPMFGSLVLCTVGLGSVSVGRHRQRRDRLHADRVARTRGALRDPAQAGVSPGVAGSRRLPPPV